MLKFTGVGVYVNRAVGVPAGGKITPGGTRRMSTLGVACAGELIASVPIADARIDTVLPDPPASAGGAAGAVYTVVARPSEPVTTVRAPSVPKSCGTPLTAMLSRSARPDRALP